MAKTEHLIGLSEHVWVGNKQMPTGIYDRCYVETNDKTKEVIFRLRKLGLQVETYKEPVYKESWVRNKPHADLFADNLRSSIKWEKHSPEKIKPRKVEPKTTIIPTTQQKSVQPEKQSIPVIYENDTDCDTFSAEDLAEVGSNGFFFTFYGHQEKCTIGEIVQIKRNHRKKTVTIYWLNERLEPCRTSVKSKNVTNYGPLKK